MLKTYICLVVLFAPPQMDANARTGRREKGQVGSKDSKILGAYGRDTLNDNGELLLSFANNHDLALVNTFFSTPKGGVSHTFNGRGKKRIDYILTTQRDRKFVRNVTVHPQPSFLPISDHNIVSAPVTLLGQGKTLPTPALEESETVSPHIGIYQVADVVGHRRGQGRHSPHNYIYRLRLKGFGPEADLTRSHNVRNLLQHTALNINLRQSRLLLAISGSILLRKTAIPPVVISHRKTVVPSKTNPLFANVLAISGSIVLRKTAIPSVATPHRKTAVPSKANPLFASALLAISRSIVLRKTVIPSEAIAHRKTVVRSNANPLLASANPDLARIKRKIIQRGESE